MSLTLSVASLRKSFTAPEGTRHDVVRVEEFCLQAGEECALAGPSGIGKTTFLNLLSGLLAADAGSIEVVGQQLFGLPEARRDLLRARHIGYIFQTFRLLPALTALENILLGMSIAGKVDRARARQLLDEVGLGAHHNHLPRQMSAGQKQRVAVARALANQPSLVLADEPTGSLDPATADSVLTLIRRMCQEANAALLVVSHDPAVLSSFPRQENFQEMNHP